MTDVTDYVKQQGSFLKPEIVEASPTKTFVITQEGNLVRNEKYGTDRLHLNGEMDGNSYTFDSSKSNARTIAEKLGSMNSTNWVGAKVILSTYKMKNSEGKLVDAINVDGATKE